MKYFLRLILAIGTLLFASVLMLHYLLDVNVSESILIFTEGGGADPVIVEATQLSTYPHNDRERFSPTLFVRLLNRNKNAGYYRIKARLRAPNGWQSETYAIGFIDAEKQGVMKVWWPPLTVRDSLINAALWGCAYDVRVESISARTANPY